jgi:hypothetical protein
MATAAVLDARQKDRRRRVLDAQIDEARSKLAVLLEQSHARDLAQIVKSPPPSFYDGSLEALDVLKYICNIRPEFLLEVEPKHQSRARALKRLRMDLGISWDVRETVGTSTLVKCEEILALEKTNPNVPRREPRTERQMAKTTDMINHLVDLLLTEAYWQSEAEAPNSHPSLDSPDSARTMIRLLRSEGYPRYNHPDVDLNETAESRARLNETNLSILADWVRPYRERYVAKICYNLLVCGVPPAIENYNALILGFARLGEHALAQAVVDSFLYKSHLKPTEGTFLCLLHHYRLKKDIVGFWGLLRRLFGHDPRGIGLRRRTGEEIRRIDNFRRWAEETGVTAVNGYFVERAELTQNLVEAMMEGLIDFRMLREAAKLVVICLQEGWQVGSELLARLFYACINSLDASAARILIQGLLDNIGQASCMILGPGAVEPSMVRQLRHLLNICQATSLPGTAEFHPWLWAGPSSSTRLRHLATAIWIRETWNNSRIMTSRLKRAKQALHEQRPLSSRLNLALAVLDFEADRPMRKLENTELVQRMAKIAWLESQCEAAARKIVEAETDICNVLARRVPKELRTFFDFNPKVAIQKRIKSLLRFWTPGTKQHQMAECYARSREIETELKVALLVALPTDLAKPVLATQNNTGDISLGKILVHFERYLMSFKHKGQKQAETAPQGDPFSQLLEKLPKPTIRFWPQAPTTGAAASEQKW